MLWQRALRSDRGTYAGAAYEYLLADLRPGFGRIAVPVEFVVPADNEAAATAAADAYEVLCAGVRNWTSRRSRRRCISSCTTGPTSCARNSTVIF